MISKIAAAFVLVLVSGIVIGYYLNDSQASTFSDSIAMREYRIAEQKYVKNINSKLNVLRTHNVDYQVSKDMMQLDEVFDELKGELKKGANVNNNQIIKALILNYEVKVEILEKVLSRVNEQNEGNLLKSISDETISI